MRVGFDAKRAFHNATGLGNYSRELLRIVSRHLPEHQCFAYNPGRGRVAFELPARCTERRPSTLLGRLLPSAWRSSGVVRDLVRDGIELFHGLAGELPLGLERTGIAGVVTVHDVIFERFPELYSPIDRRIYRAKTRSACERARLIIAVSEQTRADLVERYQVPAAKVRVVYQGCREIFRERIRPEELAALSRRLELPLRFVLSVGTIEKRKNLLHVLRALPGLPQVGLVVAGRSTSYRREVDALIRSERLEGRVRFLEGLGARELAGIYRLASALVYTSLFEGFGIPIVEALVSGTPVVTTRGGVFPEAAGPGSAYVDPHDSEQLRSVLSEILEDPARRVSMAEAGRAFSARFSDEAIAGGFGSVYREALALR